MNKSPEVRPSVTVRQATLDLLRSLGMTTVFGNPGSTELGFLDDWPSDLRYVLALQEASVVGIADGYAQATNRAAFVNLHSAAGLGNALGNIFTAFKNQTPLVIMAGQQTRSLLPLDPYLCARDAIEFPRPYVKWACEPARAEDVPTALAQAYYMAMQRPRGPVYVSVPSDDWTALTEPIIARSIAWEFGPDQSLLSELAASIKRSSRPTFVFGSAIDREGAYDLAVALAERVDAPVWEAPVSSRSSFPEDHRLFAGFLPAVPEELAESLQNYDLIVVIGAPVFSFHVPGECRLFRSGVPIFQIIEDVTAAAQSPSTTTILGTMKPSLTALLELLPSRSRVNGVAQRSAPASVAATKPLSIDFVMHVLSEVIPADAVIVEEAPSHRPAMQQYLPIRQSGGYYTMASGGLGYGLPAAVGIALAQQRRVICLLGDGSAMYSIQALWTAVQHKLPLTIVILNNKEYKALKSFSKLLKAKEPPPGVDLPGLDFAALAAGFGFRSIQIDDAERLKPELVRALLADDSVLVDIAIDPSTGSIY